MPPHMKRPRNAVGFTKFRRILLTAYQGIRSTFCDLPEVPVDAAIIAYACESALIEGRFADAVGLANSLSEQQYGDARSHRLGNQLAALVKKVPFEDPELDPNGVAVKKFLAVEHAGVVVNEELRRFFAVISGHTTDSKWRIDDDEAGRMSRLILRARYHMHRVLGKKPPLTKIYGMCRLGSGSSVGVAGDRTHLMRKLTAETWTVSHVAESYVRAAAMATPCFWDALGLDASNAQPLYEDPMSFYVRKGALMAPSIACSREAFSKAWRDRIEYCDYDLITCVPKKADCARTVGSQPLLNMFVQLGAGDYLQQVLRDRCGIDIRSAQTEVNGPLALLGSSCEGMPIATIDLKSASDSYYIMLARLLLPDEWFSFLNAIRTPSYLLPEAGDDEVPSRYEKFMAMGNGFCFPLQTLTFWCLIQAVYDHNIVPGRLCAVYGDDIIVYQSAALELIELLQSVGFDTNVDKTFVHGPFRESCGQDYFGGINVRPVVVDEVFENYGQVYNFINSLQRRGYTTLSRELREMLPNNRLVRPITGDPQTALEVPWEEFMSSRHAFYSKPLQAWSWREFITIPVVDTTDYDPSVYMACILAGASSCSRTGRPTYARRRKTLTQTREMWRVGDHIDHIVG